MKRNLLSDTFQAWALAGLVMIAGALPGSATAQAPEQPSSAPAQIAPAAARFAYDAEYYLLDPSADHPRQLSAVHPHLPTLESAINPSAGQSPALRAAAEGSIDLAIARALRETDLQESGTARAVAGVFRLASLPGTLLLAGVLYGIGELENRPDLSDLGLNTGQAIIGAGAVTLAGKLTTGRARPRISPENASDFGFGRGFQGNDYQAFPSAHTAAAFAAGTVLAMGVTERHPDSAVWVYPSIYAAAGMAGLSRLFEEEHWATDIVAGALIGIAGGIVVKQVHD